MSYIKLFLKNYNLKLKGLKISKKTVKGCYPNKCENTGQASRGVRDGQWLWVQNLSFARTSC